MVEPRRTNLAPLPTSFIGRRGSLEALALALQRSRLVTVLGPPGAGKTRLVKQYALSLLGASGGASEPRGGVFFCDLTEATNPAGVIARVAPLISSSSSDLGASLPIDEAKRRVEAALRTREPTLLILDNVEQLVRAAGPLFQDLLAAAAEDTRFLVTSRERLGVPGEALFDLPPLSLPDDAVPRASEAVDLFIERARDADHAFQPSEAEVRDIAKLVRLLDGLPLAIELAAARMRILTPSELVERLGSRFGLLTQDPSTSRAHRATLWETIEASWALLSPWEQAALSQVSAFRGGFSVHAAESVLDLRPFQAAPSPLDVLQSLRDKSLLLADDREGSARRLTLLGSIRDFGEAKRSAAETAALHARHARYFLELGEALSARLDVHDDPEIRRKLRADHENFLAVHQRFLRAPTPADLRGASLRAALILSSSASAYPYALSLEALDLALSTSEEREVGRLLFARALEARGNIRRFVGQTRESVDDFERVLSLAELEGDRDLAARALCGLGNAATVRARWDEAGELFERALAIIVEKKDRRAEGRVLAMLAATLYNRDDPARARSLLTRAIELERECKDRGFEGISVTSLGIVSLAAGALSEARAHLAEGLFIHRDVGARHWEGVTLSYMALAEQEAGRMSEAQRLYDEALAILSEINVRRAEGLALAGSAGACLLDGQLAVARERYRRALDLTRAMSPDHEGLFLACLGAIAALDADTVAASDLFESAERALMPYARPAFAAAIDVHRGQLDIARARDLPGGGGEAFHAEARARHERGAAWADRSVEVRFARGLLARSLAAFEAERPVPDTKLALAVGPEGAWFKPPRAKASVRLHRRRALKRLMHELAEHRLRAPGEALPIPLLVERGWPGERVLPEAGTERVYSAVATLRRLGLRKVLLQRDDGYLLDPEVSLVRSLASA